MKRKLQNNKASSPVTLTDTPVYFEQLYFIQLFYRIKYKCVVTEDTSPSSISCLFKLSLI